MKETLYDKVFSAHSIESFSDGTSLVYIDRHLVHEVTSPQAFEGLLNAKRAVRRRDLTLSTVDHNIPTSSRDEPYIKDKESRLQVEALERNVALFGLSYFGMLDKRQGIVHVIGPEQGFTLPGSTLVCGDSHTSTHGAFGSLAFGIGTSEVEHVLATQTLRLKKSKNMLIKVLGNLLPGVESKDVVLHIISVLGTAGGNGHVVEFAGPVIESLSMEARMSICNMTIEAGARAGLIAPDKTTFDYLKGRPLSPKGILWDRAVEYWKTLHSDPGCVFDYTLTIDANEILPCVTWGTSPQDVVPITGLVPSPESYQDEAQRKGVERSLEYMGLTPHMKMTDITIDKVFIGSCTNSRIEDLRSVARIVKNRKVSSKVYAMIVPGSGLVKQQAEDEGLSTIFIDAGFDWREAGCSMCLGMNEDKLKEYERCASTSNRNFEGRQGFKGRTHLMSPAMAAAAAITGRLTDVRDFLAEDEKDEKSKGPVEIRIEKDSVEYTRAFTDEDYKEPTMNPISVTTTTSMTSTSGMPKFTILVGKAAPLPMSNVDTDKIIPKQFLKTVKRTGLGNGLFYEMRYNRDGVENPDFVLNQVGYRNSVILISYENFGCGSSREHAPWALLDFGIKCIIAPSFADIFETNTTKNGMLPITLARSQIDVLMKDAIDGHELEINLPDQMITRSTGEMIRFEIEPFRKHCLVNGLDNIGLTLQNVGLIEEFERMRTRTFPWLDGMRAEGGLVAALDVGVDW